MREFDFESKFLYQKFSSQIGCGNIREMQTLLNYDWDKIASVSLVNCEDSVIMEIELKNDSPLLKKIILSDGDILAYYNDNYVKVNEDIISNFKNINKIIRDENENT